MSNHQLSGSPIFQTNPACTSKSPALVDILLNRVLTCETTGNRFYEFCQSYCTNFRPLRLTSPFLQRTWDGFVFVQSPLDCGCPLDGKLRCFPHENMVEANYTKKKDNLGFLGTAGTARSVSPPAYGLRNLNVPRSYCCCT